MITEVCIETPADARAATSGGADRLELCRDLAVGGLTPEIETLRHVVAATPLPVVAMLRWRSGGFHYTPAEVTMMRDEVATLIAAGARGLVFGAVGKDGQPDRAAVTAIREALDAAASEDDSRPELVFHRAFDSVPDQAAALEVLIGLGVDRVLSSGHPDGVAHGRDRLAALVAQTRDRITVMPGGGVREDNIADLLAATGAREVHFSARTDPHAPTDAAAVRAMIRCATAGWRRSTDPG